MAAMLALARRLANALVVVLAATGCAFPALDVSDYRCPCGAGYVCDEPRDRCVLAGDAGLASVCASAADPLFCDGFEGAAMVRVEGDDAVVNTDPRFPIRRGTGALHCTFSGAAGDTTLGHATFDDAPELWVRLDAALGSVPAAGLGLAQLNPVGGPEGSYVSIGATNVGVLLNASYPYVGESAPTAVYADHAWTAGRYYCLELHVVRGTPGSTFELFVDGAEVAELANLDVDEAATFPELLVGPYYFADEEGPISFDIDDVAVSTTRIGCP